LLYEGLVGQYLNKIGKQFPAFVETYGIYHYNPLEPAYPEMRVFNETDQRVLKAGLTKIPVVHPVHLDLACKESKYMAVLIQHLNEAKPIQQFLNISDFIFYEILYVLYQVYMPLSRMAYQFTHYDLHYENVLIYEPVKGKYIQYHYHKTDLFGSGPSTVVSFKSRYIAKIIDYGRCFFDDKVANPGFTGSSQGIYTEACSAPRCISCGGEQGFQWLKYNPAKLAQNMFVSSQVHNVSHDLRLLYMIKFSVRAAIKASPAVKPLMGELHDIIEKVEYGNGIKLDPYHAKLAKDPLQWVYYGTKENTKTGLPKKINNVMDASKELERLIESPWYKSKNETKYGALTKLGDLHIYDDIRPMRFVPA